MKKYMFIILVCMAISPVFADQSDFFYGIWTEARCISVNLGSSGGTAYATAQSLSENTVYVSFTADTVETNFTHGEYQVLWSRPSVSNRCLTECMLKVSTDNGIELWHVSTVDSSTIMVCVRTQETVSPRDDTPFLSDSLLIGVYSK